MRCVILADTHGMHMQMKHKIPDGDCIIHCGDFCNNGTMLDCIKFLNWFGTLPHSKKFFIAGNHDEFFEKASQSEINAIIPPGIIYLNESGVEIEGLKFWGSPYTPAFFDWSFMYKRGEEGKKHWNLVPPSVDILVSHGPARGFVDVCEKFDDPGKMEHAGCDQLLEAINRVKPIFHVSGHIHNGYGNVITKDTTFLNASVCDEHYRPVNKPWIADIIDKKVTLIHTI